MADEKKCFVIMPITVPAPMVEKYPDGEIHFQHVYHCLFEPSIRKAGFTPIPPKAEGSDLIHAGIIGNLESADLVLCDMSCLNPNVFFEWGIRTALNKPVCVVKDELATYVPFDIGILNYQEYESTLPVWEIEAEQEKLTAHLIASATKAGEENALWKYFGLSPKTKGQPYQVPEGADGKLEYIAMQVESLAKRMEAMAGEKYTASKMAGGVTPAGDTTAPSIEAIHEHLNIRFRQDLGEFGIRMGRLEGGGYAIFLRANPAWSQDLATQIVHELENSFRVPVYLKVRGR